MEIANQFSNFPLSVQAILFLLGSVILSLPFFLSKKNDLLYSIFLLLGLYSLAFFFITIGKITREYEDRCNEENK